MINDFENIKPFIQKFTKDLFSFDFEGKQCVLIPFPHKEMANTLLNKYHEDEKIDYTFMVYANGETIIHFNHINPIDIGHLYNVVLNGNYIVAPLSKMSNFDFAAKPNANYTYLIAIPF